MAVFISIPLLVLLPGYSPPHRADEHTPQLWSMIRWCFCQVNDSRCWEVNTDGHALGFSGSPAADLMLSDVFDIPISSLTVRMLDRSKPEYNTLRSRPNLVKKPSFEEQRAHTLDHIGRIDLHRSRRRSSTNKNRG